MELRGRSVTNCDLSHLIRSQNQKDNFNDMLDQSQSEEDNKEVMKMIKNVGAKTDDDIEQDEIDLDKQLGGLTKLGVMNDLISQLKK
jgi:predicted nucleotidyltransferase